MIEDIIVTMKTDGDRIVMTVHHDDKQVQRLAMDDFDTDIYDWACAGMGIIVQSLLKGFEPTQKHEDGANK